MRSLSPIAFAALLLTAQPVVAQDTGRVSDEDFAQGVVGTIIEPASVRMCEVTSESDYMKCLLNGRGLVIPHKARPAPGGTMSPIPEGDLAGLGSTRDLPESIWLPRVTEGMIAGIPSGYSVPCTPLARTAYVQFDFASASLKRREMENLWRLADIATRIDLAGCDIRLSGHADASGGAGANMALSDKRARAALDVMARAGIDPARIWAKGYGETRLHPDYIDTPMHRQHRRVELVFVPRR